MANLSIAKGRLVLEGDWSALDIDALIITLKKTESWGYDITLIGETHTEKHKKLTKDGAIDFSGTGRWSFHNNLFYLYSWLVNAEVKPGENYFKAFNTLMKTITEKDLVMRWEYTDCEGGNDFIKVAVGEHRKGFNYPEIILYSELYSEVYPFSLRSYFDNVLNGKDDGTVEETAEFLAEAVDLDLDFVYNTIMKHPTFYGLPLWDYEFEVSELDEELLKDLGLAVQD